MSSAIVSTVGALVRPPPAFCPELEPRSRVNGSPLTCTTSVRQSTDRRNVPVVLLVRHRRQPRRDLLCALSEGQALDPAGGHRGDAVGDHGHGLQRNMGVQGTLLTTATRADYRGGRRRRADLSPLASERSGA